MIKSKSEIGEEIYMLKKYKMRFNVWGLILFLIIMIPNFYWFTVPAPNDILRTESVTAKLDIIASVCQVLMLIALCILINIDCKKHRFSLLILATIISCICYFIGWIFYYKGIINTLVILDLCILPCLAFLFYAIDRKNKIAVVPIVIFMICHLIYGIVNYII